MMLVFKTDKEEADFLSMMDWYTKHPIPTGKKLKTKIPSGMTEKEAIERIRDNLYSLEFTD